MLTMTNVPARGEGAEPLSGDYSVFLNGEECPVYCMRVSRVPFAQMQYQPRDIGETELASFVNFTSDSAVRVEVQLLTREGEIAVRPRSRNVQVLRTGRTVSFTLETPGQYSFECGDEHCALHLFFNAPAHYGGKERFTHYFGPGIHRPGVIRLKDGDRVYIDDSAVVYGSFFASGAKHIEIAGRGVLDGSGEERALADCYDGAVSLLRFCACESVAIEGLILRDAPLWVVNLFACRGVTVKNIKIIGQWRPNTDGIDMVNSSDISISDSFVRTFDDCISLKGIDRYQHLDVENIAVSGCVLWNGWGRTLEVGLETACRTYRNISFTDCDLIHNSAVALDIQNGDFAEVSGVRFERIRVEYQAYTQPEQLRQEQSETYRGGAGWIPKLIVVNNFRMRACYTFLPPNDTVYENSFIVHDVLYKDIYVLLEGVEGLPEIRIESLMEGVEFYDIAIDGLYLNGRRVTHSEELNLTVNRTRNFRLT